MPTTRLGKVQLQIMQVLWERGKASAREITDALQPKSDLAHSTIQTLLRKMESKGVITHEVNDRTFVFRPLVDPKSITRSATRDFIERVFGGSTAGLIAHLLTEERIDASELQELRGLIDRHDTKRGKKP
jgi:BlaI family penicillinase repressor